MGNISKKPNPLILYYRLAKPGIIYGNAVTALAGFFVASKRQVDLGLMVGMLVGLSLIIGAACVFNNYLDRGIDRKMARTKNRALAADLIPVRGALIYGLILVVSGSLILAALTNLLTLSIALAGFLVYVGAYSPLKPRTTWATLVGSIAGAVPPVVGYTAVANKLDGAALLLFLILVFWQMPHFYAIAIYRLNDYKNAGVPVLPARNGLRFTKIQIVLYILAFTIAAGLLGVLRYLGRGYLVVALAASIYWLWQAWDGWRAADTRRWARQMFGTSLLVITALSAAMIIDSLV